MTDLSGATVTLEYNALKKLEENEAALDAIVQHISRSTTVEEGDWIDDDTIARSTLRIDLKALKPLLLKYCLYSQNQFEFLEANECNIIFEYGEHSITKMQEESA
ncbi:hypothetical protein ACQCN2_00975 [Brevibacillus ginsengisoli]|uniref:hypothetical protein n=1 Tax=Brevibacillus ginsengisoli TaxID=363854 RepID=UPI003CF2C08A